MKNIKLFLLGAVLFGGSVCGAAPQTYKIDPVHTFVMFKVSHLGFSTTYGRFTDVSGEFVIDAEKPTQSKVDFRIKTKSISTHDGKRDKHLRGPDFFFAKRYPEIMFKSGKVKKIGKDKYQVSGELNLHGVKKPLTVTFEQNRTGKDPWGAVRTGGEISFSIKRSDFGMNYMQGKDAIGDTVEILMSVEGIKK